MYHGGRLRWVAWRFPSTMPTTVLQSAPRDTRAHASTVQCARSSAASARSPRAFTCPASDPICLNIVIHARTTRRARCGVAAEARAGACRANELDMRRREYSEDLRVLLEEVDDETLDRIFESGASLPEIAIAARHARRADEHTALPKRAEDIVRLIARARRRDAESPTLR